MLKIYNFIYNNILNFIFFIILYIIFYLFIKLILFLTSVTAGTADYGQLTKPYETPLGFRPEDIRGHSPPSRSLAWSLSIHEIL